MKVVLFDLGDTLEHDDTLLPGAVETLTAVAGLRDDEGPVRMGLLSDFDMADDPAEIPGIRAQYLAILDQLGIRGFFEPVDVGVTLSTDVGVFKPDPRVFRAALDKFGAGFGSAMFVTENRGHVLAARSLGMRAVHLVPVATGPDDITELPQLVPLVSAFASTADGAEA